MQVLCQPGLTGGFLEARGKPLKTKQKQAIRKMARQWDLVGPAQPGKNSPRLFHFSLGTFPNGTPCCAEEGRVTGLEVITQEDLLPGRNRVDYCLESPLGHAVIRVSLGERPLGGEKGPVLRRGDRALIIR